MKVPNLFIVGAPKCGTTTLALWLRQHPQVFVPSVKEPNFFSKDHPASRGGREKDYLRLFKACPQDASFAVDASVWYLYSSVAIENVLAFNPFSRFIVCIRNPVDMAVSLYLQLLESLQEDADDFETAWKLQEKRSKQHSLPSTCQHPERLLYGPVCSLGTQLDKLYERVAEERIHVVVLDDLAANPATEWARLCHFLGVKPMEPKEWRVENPASKMRSRNLTRVIKAGGRMKRRLGIWYSFGLKRWNTKRIDKPEISQAIRTELASYFENDIRKLEDRLGRSLEHWYTEAKAPGPTGQEGTHDD